MKHPLCIKLDRAYLTIKNLWLLSFGMSFEERNALRLKETADLKAIHQAASELKQGKTICHWYYAEAARLKKYIPKHADYAHFTSSDLMLAARYLTSEVKGIIGELSSLGNEKLLKDANSKYGLEINSITASMLARLELTASHGDITYDDIIADLLEQYHYLKQTKQLPNQVRHGLNRKAFFYFHRFVAKYGNSLQLKTLKNLPWFKAGIVWLEDREIIFCPPGLSLQDLASHKKQPEWFFVGNNVRYEFFKDAYPIIAVDLAYQEITTSDDRIALPIIKNLSSMLQQNYERLFYAKKKLKFWHLKSKKVFKKYEKWLDSVNNKLVIKKKLIVKNLSNKFIGKLLEEPSINLDIKALTAELNSAVESYSFVLCTGHIQLLKQIVNIIFGISYPSNIAEFNKALLKYFSSTLSPAVFEKWENFHKYKVEIALIYMQKLFKHSLFDNIKNKFVMVDGNYIEASYEVAIQCINILRFQQIANYFYQMLLNSAGSYLSAAKSVKIASVLIIKQVGSNTLLVKAIKKCIGSVSDNKDIKTLSALITEVGCKTLESSLNERIKSLKTVKLKQLLLDHVFQIIKLLDSKNLEKAKNKLHFILSKQAIYQNSDSYHCELISQSLNRLAIALSERLLAKPGEYLPMLRDLLVTVEYSGFAMLRRVVSVYKSLPSVLFITQELDQFLLGEKLTLSFLQPEILDLIALGFFKKTHCSILKSIDGLENMTIDTHLQQSLIIMKGAIMGNKLSDNAREVLKHYKNHKNIILLNPCSGEHEYALLNTEKAKLDGALGAEKLSKKYVDKLSSMHSSLVEIYTPRELAVYNRKLRAVNKLIEKRGLHGTVSRSM